MIETLAHGYSSENAQLGLSNEYKHEGDLNVFQNVCIIVLWNKVASALDGLSHFMQQNLERKKRFNIFDQ